MKKNYILMITPQIKSTCLTESKNMLLTKSIDRIKDLGEVFTPTELVLEILEQLPIEIWEDR